jgi:hypothetical protein
LEEEMEEVIERADRAEMTVSDFVVIGLLWLIHHPRYTNGVLTSNYNATLHRSVN